MNRLTFILTKLPKNYLLELITENYFQQILRLEWTKKLCNNLHFYAKLVNAGVRFIILTGKIMGVDTLSSLANNEMMKIDVESIEHDKDKGLALINSAKQILVCLLYYISFYCNASNQVATKLTWKLSYSLNKPYNAYTV